MVDTTILLSGNIWLRWPYEVLQHALKRDFYLVLSQFLIDEARQKFTEKFPDYQQGFKDFLTDCDYDLVPGPSVEEIVANQDLMRDPNDIPIALAAINAQVDYFISEDKHFTARDETTAKLHQQLNIMLSGTFLRQVMGWTSEALEAVRGREWSDVENSS